MFVCLFVCLFVCSPTPPRSLGRSSLNLEGRWWAAPVISLRGSFFERSRSSRSKVIFSFLFCSPTSIFFLFCSPTSPRSLGRSSPNLVGRLRAAPDIFLKVKVKGQICFFFLFVPLLLPGPWANPHKTWWEG